MIDKKGILKMVITLARTSDGVLFQAELRPNQSSTPETIRKLALTLCVALIPAGLIFVYVGAWPVFGFLGLELVALIALLNYHHKRSYIIERIAITSEDLRVERIDPWGRRRIWSFQRHWLQVNVDDKGERDCELELRSHGRALVIGTFLTTDERREFARHLRNALHAAAHPHPILDQSSPNTCRIV